MLLNQDMGLFKFATTACSFSVHVKACSLTILLIVFVSLHCRSVYACEACQPPPLDSPTVSKSALRKTTVDTISAEIGDDVDDDGVLPEKRPTRYSHSIQIEISQSLKIHNIL